MRIALIEWTLGGHHEIYLKTTAAALAKAGHEVWIVYPYPGPIRDELVAADPSIADLLKAYALNRNGRFVNAPRPHIQFPAKWMAARKALRSIGLKFDLVFFMYLDEFMITLVPTMWLDAAFRYPWAGIYMQPLFRQQDSALGKRPELMRRDHLLRSKKFKGAMPLDAAAVPWLTERFKRKFVGAPEFGNIAPADMDARVVQELIKFADGRPIIGAFGALSKRKGILTLLRAAPLLSDLNCVIALAGPLGTDTFTPSELTELDMVTTALKDSCWYRPSKIETDGEFSGLIAASSVCYLAYEDWLFGSGLQSIAAEFDVPTVVGDLGVMKDNAEEYGTGISIDPKSTQEAAQAIRKLLQKKLLAEGFEKYRGDHPLETLEKDICVFVEAVVG